MTDKRVTDYLAAFESEARGFGLRDASDIRNDVHSHINEALEYGKPLDAVFASLGTPRTLARAYAVELLMERPKAQSTLGRFAKLAALVAFGGFATLVVVTAVGATGLSLTLSGLLLLVLGLLEAAGVHLPHVQTNGVPPLLVAALGPVLIVAGWALLRLLAGYVRFAGRQITRAIPRRG